MHSMASTSMMLMAIATLVMMIASILSKKTLTDREKSSPFECGFDPKSSSRLPFSLQFFLIAIIFLVFDVEIALIMPLVMIIETSNMMTWTMTSMVFMVILLMGLYHEWKQGALAWSS
uniref:NADH-ubiquinone oxidoreductase chain 3 n=1 Tax=Satanas sp. KW-2016 TaxID=1812712 RepID=A0A164R3L1_9MUSC|nr:NADH dehydrogenase subunit 3 [Satanas sp. KW-2016]